MSHGYHTAQPYVLMVVRGPPVSASFGGAGLAAFRGSEGSVLLALCPGERSARLLPPSNRIGHSVRDAGMESARLRELAVARKRRAMFLRAQRNLMNCAAVAGPGFRANACSVGLSSIRCLSDVSNARYPSKCDNFRVRHIYRLMSRLRGSRPQYYKAAFFFSSKMTYSVGNRLREQKIATSSAPLAF
jgi:hypothetical protein